MVDLAVSVSMASPLSSARRWRSHGRSARTSSDAGAGGLRGRRDAEEVVAERAVRLRRRVDDLDRDVLLVVEERAEPPQAAVVVLLGRLAAARRARERSRTRSCRPGRAAARRFARRARRRAEMLAPRREPLGDPHALPEPERLLRPAHGRTVERMQAPVHDRQIGPRHDDHLTVVEEPQRREPPRSPAPTRRRSACRSTRQPSQGRAPTAASAETTVEPGIDIRKASRSSAGSAPRLYAAPRRAPLVEPRDVLDPPHAPRCGLRAERRDPARDGDQARERHRGRSPRDELHGLVEPSAQTISRPLACMAARIAVSARARSNTPPARSRRPNRIERAAASSCRRPSVGHPSPAALDAPGGRGTYSRWRRTT